MSFKNDLKKGNKGENEVIKVFKKHGIELVKNTDAKHLKDFDLIGKIGTKKITIEVKYDYMSEKTGNIALEFYNSSKDEASGIDCTKSKVWAHIIMDMGFPTIWVTSTKTLKAYIKKNKPFRIVENAGDGNANLYLYNIDTILSAIFHRIDKVTKDAFSKIIKEVLK